MTNNEKIIRTIDILVKKFRENKEALETTTYEPARKFISEQNESILYAIHILTLNSENEEEVQDV